MMKKLMMIFCLMFVSVQAQDIDEASLNLEFQELVYDMGISLASQDLIVDNETGKNALMHVYNQVDQVGQILDLFMMIDEDIVEQEITNLDDLIDYEIRVHNDFAQSAIAWLAAYQHVFVLFLQIHGSQASFVDWCYDLVTLSSLEPDEEFSDPAYQALWQASCDVIQAQKVFEAALLELE